MRVIVSKDLLTMGTMKTTFLFFVEPHGFVD